MVTTFDDIMMITMTIMICIEKTNSIRIYQSENMEVLLS